MPVSKSFKAFLVEGAISESKLNAALLIFKKYLERNLSTKLYRFGGDEGVVEIKNGVGIQYFFNKFESIRFNYIKGQIPSITLWPDLRRGRAFTIDLGGLSLKQSAETILDLIKSPAAGERAVLPDPSLVNEELELLFEGKRLSPAEFFRLVKAELRAGESVSNVPIELLTSVTVKNGVSLPSVVWQYKKAGKRGEGKFFDLSPLEHATGSPVASGSTDPVTITVTPTDKLSMGAPHTLDADKKASALESAVQNAMANPNVKEEMKDPNTLFGILKNLVQLVCRGARKSLLIYGGPGTGKTFTVTETLEEEGEIKGKDWILVKGRITTPALYQMLFLHRKDTILVFDDTDSVWGDQDAANLLKAALDSYDVRTISWISTRTINVSKMSDAEKDAFNQTVEDAFEANPEESYKVKMPSEFNYEGRIIFISNLPYKKFDSAVMTRAAKIDMTLTDDQMFARMAGVLKFLGSKDVPLEKKEEIVDFLKEKSKSGTMAEISMRTYVAAEDLYRSGLPNWKQLLDFV